MRRPGPIRWLIYAFGGHLPPEYSEWVRHDTTCSTWLLRHLSRVLVVITVPVAVIMLWLPASIGVRGLTAFTCAACAVLLTSILSNDMTERRLQAAGYEWGTGAKLRSARATETQRQANQRRRERIAARRARP